MPKLRINLSAAICPPAAMAILVLASCATVSSKRLDPTEGTPGILEDGSGVAYFLPKVKLKIRAEKHEAPKKPSGDSPGAKGTLASLENNVSVNVTVGTDQTKKDTAGAKTGDETSLVGGYYDVSLATEILPDPDNLYLLREHNSAFADDRLRVKVNQRGLLTSVASTNTDRSGEVIIDLAKIAIEGAKLAAGLPTPSSFVASDMRRGKVTPHTLPRLVEVSIDPTVQSDIDKANKALAGTGLKIDIHPEPMFGRDLETYHGLKPLPEDRRDGILYRPSLPYTLTITSEGSKQENHNVVVENALNTVFEARKSVISANAELKTKEVKAAEDAKAAVNGLLATNHPANMAVDVARTNATLATNQMAVAEAVVANLLDERSVDTIVRTILVPNEAPIINYVPSRALMVERITDITLEDGFLREVYMSKPSSAAAVVKVPLTIIKSIVALPTELIQLRVNHSTAITSLTQSQQAQIDALKALLDSQRAYSAALTNSEP